MSDALLKKKIRLFFREQLEPKGFVLKKLRMPERHLKGLRQSLEFQPGDRSLSGKFTVNVCWTFMFPTPDEHAFHGCRRIGELAGRIKETWFSREPDKLDKDFDCVAQRILDFALPYLDLHNSVEAIMASYERGDITAIQAFGPDVGWQLFRIGFCYAQLGQPANAIPHLRLLVEKHSSYPYEWVKVRRARVEEELARLERGFPQIAADVRILEELTRLERAFPPIVEDTRHERPRPMLSGGFRAQVREWMAKLCRRG